jgi:hypothetical protein
MKSTATTAGLSDGVIEMARRCGHRREDRETLTAAANRLAELELELESLRRGRLTDAAMIARAVLAVIERESGELETLAALVRRLESRVERLEESEENQK